MTEIENYKKSYENLIDKVTLEIEDFVKKNNSNTSVWKNISVKIQTKKKNY